MYSPNVIERRLFKAKKDGLQYRRLPREESIDRAEKLERLRTDGRGRLLPEGQLTRSLLPSEQAFIDSELLLCKCDAEYYMTRYHKVEIDPGVIDYRTSSDSEVKKISAAPLIESQKRYIQMFGRREDECYAELKKYGLTIGIAAYIHKVRQVMATSTMRALTFHRMIFWPGTRAFAASLDAPRVSELFKRDREIAYPHLPFWMQPRLSADVKDTELAFEHPISSRIAYQAENQTNGIGTGSQMDVSHLTEVGLWTYPDRIHFSFWPGVPKAITTLHVQESTSAGRGYWSEVTEAARKGKRGYEGWVYVFIPWYMNMLKYRANVPDEWVPSDHTQRHADLIERTSPEFFDGKRIVPNRSQLYWWESERAKYAEQGQLASFLANYPATPEQSFQNPEGGALPVELIEIMEQEAMPGVSFDVEIAEVA